METLSRLSWMSKDMNRRRSQGPLQHSDEDPGHRGISASIIIPMTRSESWRASRTRALICAQLTSIRAIWCILMKAAREPLCYGGGSCELSMRKSPEIWCELVSCCRAPSPRSPPQSSTGGRKHFCKWQLRCCIICTAKGSQLLRSSLGNSLLDRVLVNMQICPENGTILVSNFAAIRLA
jgi:hypothetical protein